MLFFFAYLMAPIWKTVRGGTVTVSAWRLPVPKGYSAWRSDSLFAFGFGAPLLNDHYGHISVFTKTARPDLTPQRIENAIVAIAQQDGYILEERRTILNGSETNYCFQFSEQPLHSKVIIRCMNESGELSVYFEGNRRFSSDVYAVVTGAQKIKS
jgi:hypothetical protein